MAAGAGCSAHDVLLHGRGLVPVLLRPLHSPLSYTTQFALPAMEVAAALSAAKAFTLLVARRTAPRLLAPSAALASLPQRAAHSVTLRAQVRVRGWCAGVAEQHSPSRAPPWHVGIPSPGCHVPPAIRCLQSKCARQGGVGPPAPPAPPARSQWAARWTAPGPPVHSALPASPRSPAAHGSGAHARVSAQRACVQ